MENPIFSFWFLHNTVIPYRRKLKIYEYFSDSYHIHSASYDELKESGLLSEAEILDFIRDRQNTDLNKIYEEFTHSPFSFATLEDSTYPGILKDIYDPPFGFYYNGRLPDFEKSVSIVGARGCSEYGKKMAYELACALSEKGFTVISGMARGIDSYAHKGALYAGGKTVAVLGCGADVVYPKENAKLYEQIVANGAVISEFPMGQAPIPLNFPQRNRIVSGLSKYVIVVEAALKSGSLITADFALEQGKEIFVVPGRVGDRLSEGTNKLISDGAGIIVSVESFIKELSGEDQARIKIVSEKDKKVLKLSEEELLVYGLFDLYPKSLSEVFEKSKMDYLKLVSVVYGLVRQGLISEAFKNHFVICS